MGFSRQEYWSGLPFPSPRDLPHPGIQPVVLMSPALAGRFFTGTATWEAPQNLDGMKVTQMYVYAFVKVHGTVHLTSTHVQHYHTAVFF